MVLGIPKGLLFYQYEPFITTFFKELGTEVCYSKESDKKALNVGTKHCVDEACLPMKIFHGQVKQLQDQCDYVVVPRLMNCEYGESICPKFSGLPDLVKSGIDLSRIAFQEPLYLNNQDKLKDALVISGKRLGLKKSVVIRALRLATEQQQKSPRGICEEGYPRRVFLAGHPYHIYDRFVNLDIINKLHQLDIGIVTEESVSREEKMVELVGLMKRPYWMSFTQNYGAAKSLIRSGSIQGIIYLSSFNCGIDSFTIDMLKNSINGFPMLVLKLDEQTGEAGYRTRLEAFADVLYQDQHSKWMIN